MSSATLAVKTKNTFGNSMHIHLLGVWIFLSCATFPTAIKTIKIIGTFPLKLSDLVLVIVFFASLAKKRNHSDKLTMVSIVFIFLLPAIQGLLKDASQQQFITDYSSVLYLYFAYTQFRLTQSHNEVRIICKYIFVTLVCSLFFILLILAGRLEYSERLRVSFEYGEAVNLGRLVTNTLVLAAVSLATSITLLIQGKIKLSLFLAYFIPSFLIATFASTRFIAVFIFLPLVLSFFKKKSTGNKKAISKIVATSTFVAVALAIWQAATTSSNFVYSYITNGVYRTAIFITSFGEKTDNSLLYRLIEYQEVYRAILLRPIFGYGFGIPYTASFYNGGSRDWLTMYGVYFTHSTYSWVIIKSGVFGMLLFIFWLGYNIRRNSRVNELKTVISPTLISILIVGFVWNFIGISGESVVFGMLLGLFNCRLFSFEEKYNV